MFEFYSARRKILPTLVLILLLISRTVQAEEELPCQQDDQRPRCLFTFDEEGQVKTKDGKAERTFNFPAVKAGFIYDARHPHIHPSVTIEAIQWIWWDEDFSLNGGVAWDRLIVDLHWHLLPVLDLGPTIWTGYDFDQETLTAGIGVAIIKF